MNKKILCWEGFGIIFIFILGTLLHFLYEWSGYLRPIALFAAVNESLWEHFKLAFWPTLLFGIIEYPFLKNDANNFLIAKTVNLYLTPIIIGVLFYLYTSIIGTNKLFIDILIFIIAIAVGQLTSCKIMSADPLPNIYRSISLVALFILIVMFLTFTYYPPHLPIFMDPNTGEYGIPHR